MLAFLQKIGKALMLPVATLPAAALLLRFGAINYETEFHLGSAVGGFLNQYIAPFLLAGGSAIFDNLSLIFAVGVAIGLAGDAVAALAAVIAYMVLTAVLSKVPAAMPFIADDAKLNMGVLGGILAGGVAAYCYNRYHNIKLPEWLGFFGGKRFVPIITSLSMVIIGLLFGIVWGPIQDALTSMGNWIVGLGALGAGLFGFFNRLLIPFGLHHVLNAIAWFQIGDFTDAAGKVVHGDLNRFFAGDKSAGMFMTGFFPIMMFALPAAAFAIIHTAKPEKRKAIASVFIGTALASFLTGITEPLEFAFMFAAPLLYVIHAVLTGVSGYIVTAMGIKHGFGFSAGLIDYGLNFPLSTNAWLIIPIGLAFAVVYYFLFRILIVKMNIKTPGREDDDVEVSTTGGTNTMQEKAQKVLTLIGGKENVVNVDACITRLRLVLKDDKVVNEKGLKDLGAAGVMKLGQGSVQVVFGTQSELLKDEITKL
ncbi:MULTISPECIES: N-acetylglucosamine-specific PTS transporter subunit IIBC [Brevibacillus]|jgi:PTS system N-acetylglucosamine-specific IIC component|uniref:PTS system N-acetylglucosamine-specific IIB component, Glc family /PTS system N-acetylglucosamine-specific IIC component, Glc family n=1 Tax=Brevibacillus centrosporus TaxID=54910 RepID=A0A1I4BQT8_9BACL|nr:MULTISPECIES: N-acetylglucosamine-specific PTS transporter subunit IIBC [Brevibacillus]MDR7317516.1 PTS system N-acetylglucosamine-specific IIC component [Brevibacillus nitrificans]MEC2132791.1 N-acetylglucosamine-specific PTS transporter subunit IIBC [Brevibacillus centrosporus]MED4908394.1 N-acetylglucosamine-specific PTS transporter subunit IIBC [Brevibacillus centrosporus]RNB66589.1 PTS sugar transporter [Brevibacillus centrosporus]SFK70379.1 PTS system N-acetylglucosamine-specific IIB 